MLPAEQDSRNSSRHACRGSDGTHVHGLGLADSGHWRSALQQVSSGRASALLSGASSRKSCESGSQERV